jgi:TolA-binding protein
MRTVMSEQATLDVRGQSSALSLALAIALGAALGSSVYVIAEIRHQKQIAEHAAPPPAAEPAPAPKPKPEPAEVAKAPAAEPEKKAEAEEAEAAPPDPKAQALAARTAAEQALLDEARTQVEANNVTGALSTLDRMKKRFPRGTLVQERELLRVEAYKAKGQTVAAKRAARKFAKSFPDSPHLGDIESLLN